MKIISMKAALVFAITFILIGCSKNEQTPAQSLTKPLQDFDRENAAAVAARPDLHPTQAIAQSATQRGKEMLASAHDANDKIFLAANQFIGYYNANVKSRSEVCGSLGVDISPFVNAFKAAHANEYRITSDAYAIHNVSLDEALVVEAHGRPLIKQVMEKMARNYNITLSEMCVAFAQNADDFTSEYAYQKQQPAIYAALHGH